MQVAYRASSHEQLCELALTQPVNLFAISETYDGVAPILLFKSLLSTDPEL